MTLPGGGTQTVPLTPGTNGTSDVFTGVFTAPPNTGTTVQTYTAVFTATDTDGATASLALPGSFTVTPDLAPEIVSASVTPPTRGPGGGQFTITAHVTDDIGVSDVTAAVTGPNPIPGVTLTLQGGTAVDGTYTGTFTAPANATPSAAEYQVTVTAVDAGGRSDVESAGSGTVLPDLPPQVVTASVTPPTRGPDGGQFTVTAHVTDDVGVASVTAAITGPSPIPNVTLTLQGGNAADGTYSGTFTAPPNGGTTAQEYQVAVTAKDTAGASDVAPAGTATVLPSGGETEAPEILTCGLSPIFLPRSGGAVTITAEVVDNVGVALVEAIVTQPDGGTVLVPLSSTGGSGYQGTYNAPANVADSAVLHSVELRALDTSGNEALKDCGEVRVAGAGETPTGRLLISPLRLSFGQVLLRRQKILTFTVRHQGPNAGSVLFFRLREGLDSPFRLVSGGQTAAGGALATPSGGWIALRRGEFRTFRVAFRPRALGTFVDLLPIETSQGNRPLVNVTCVGKGCRARH